MAKTSTSKKKVAETPKKTAVKKKASATVSIDKANEAALSALKKLGIEEQLQNDIEWCLGSYRHDGNAVGLVETGIKAIKVLKAVKSKSPKAVTAKVITDLEKAIQ